MTEFKELIGQVIKNIENSQHDKDYYQTKELIITTDKHVYKMYHSQDCCESVSIESIDGNIENLIGQMVLDAYSSSNSGYENEYGDSFTWTFYTIRTMLDSVTIRWYGTSNGYYSESVDLELTQ